MANNTKFSHSRRTFLKSAATASAVSIGVLSGITGLALADSGVNAASTSAKEGTLNASGIRVIQETLFNKEKVTLINESGKLQMLDVRQPVSLHQNNGKLIVSVNQDDTKAVNGMMVMSPDQQLSFDVKALCIDVVEDLGLPTLTNLAENELQIVSAHSVFNRIVPVQVV